MKRSILLLLCLLLTSCSIAEDDGYREVRKAGWNFIKQNKWENRTSGAWEQAKVTAYTVYESQAQLLDKQYIGKKVLSVEFEDLENTALSAPVILVDQESKKVIGYLPGE